MSLLLNKASSSNSPTSNNDARVLLSCHQFTILTARTSSRPKSMLSWSSDRLDHTKAEKQFVRFSGANRRYRVNPGVPELRARSSLFAIFLKKIYGSALDFCNSLPRPRAESWLGTPTSLMSLFDLANPFPRHRRKGGCRGRVSRASSPAVGRPCLRRSLQRNLSLVKLCPRAATRRQEARFERRKFLMAPYSSGVQQQSKTNSADPRPSIPARAAASPSNL